MIFLANRANLDKRTLLTRIHNRLQSQVFNEASPVEHVWYHTSSWQYDQCLYPNPHQSSLERQYARSDSNKEIGLPTTDTSIGNKTGVRATITPRDFLETSYPVAEAELQVSFDFPQTHAYDFYRIQWVEAERNLMVGWHQDETHMNLGECHFQIDHHGETVQRDSAEFLDTHPLNVFDQRVDDLVDVLDALTWEHTTPQVPKQAVR